MSGAAEEAGRVVHQFGDQRFRDRLALGKAEPAHKQANLLLVKEAPGQGLGKGPHPDFRRTERDGSARPVGGNGEQGPAAAIP